MNTSTTEKPTIEKEFSAQEAAIDRGKAQQAEIIARTEEVLTET